MLVVWLGLGKKKHLVRKTLCFGLNYMFSFTTNRHHKLEIFTASFTNIHYCNWNTVLNCSHWLDSLLARNSTTLPSASRYDTQVRLYFFFWNTKKAPQIQFIASEKSIQKAVNNSKIIRFWFKSDVFFNLQIAFGIDFRSVSVMTERLQTAIYQRDEYNRWLQALSEAYWRHKSLYMWLAPLDEGSWAANLVSLTLMR